MYAHVPDKIGGFLKDAGWGDAEVQPIDGDASGRRYFRIGESERRAILMDAPPPEEDPGPFLHIAEYLASHGMRAPQILAAAPEHGLVLLEDFGERRMREYVDAHPGSEHAIYRAAIDALVQLHRLPPADCPAYDLDFYARELALFTEWYCDARNLDVDVAGYEAVWAQTLAPVLAQQMPGVTVLRDYHAENIMLLDDGAEGAQGLLDFQDALVGHPAYDLVSLLQDARRDVSETLEAAMLDHYVKTGLPGPGFGNAYRILGAQRNLKIVGIFVRLWKRDGKPRYLSMIPRVWAALERDLQHPALAQVKIWFDRNIPEGLRDPNGTLGGEFAV